jgi:uncharacterized protein with NAD-binding domain and iron-sulfur cluster
MAATEQPKTKIAILGGGMAALATAFHLTNQEHSRDRYEIAVYQMGWRLGGKGASGRNVNVHERIEEHGLHIWPGFYHNAFHLMQQCYHALGRDPETCPIATWKAAFKEHDFIADMEDVGRRPEPWALLAPRNASTPGIGGRWPTPFDYVSMALQMVVRHVFHSAFAARKVSRQEPGESLSWWQRLKRAAWVHLEMSLLLLEALFLRYVRHRWHRLPRQVARHGPKHHHAVMGPLDRYRNWLARRLDRRLHTDAVARRIWILVDLVHTGLRGILHDGLFVHGFDAIDDMDFRAWLKKHGASHWTLESALIRGLYDFLFAYRYGDPNQPSLAAGVGLRLCIRLAFDYKGAILWKMQAGMGDIVFAPLYEVLCQRNVKFHFFHKVKRLCLSGDESSIERIVLGRQATVKEGEYRPLVCVKGLPCWPNAPRYDQLKDGDELQRRQADLESRWTSWPEEEITLQASSVSRQGDFDVVILGVSLAALPGPCAELIDKKPGWRKMLDNVQTVQTVSAQLWLKPDLRGLGWELPSALVSACAHPLETWIDMSQTLCREDWTGSECPGNVTYLCGIWRDRPDEASRTSDAAIAAAEHERAWGAVREWLETNSGTFWPRAVTEAKPHELNWDLLVAPTGVAGADRLRHQFCKVNIEPTDRYVLSVAGTTQYRLAVKQSGCRNLYLVGDWVRNGVNFGCIESAVVSALQVCRALTGRPRLIPGETDW